LEELHDSVEDCASVPADEAVLVSEAVKALNVKTLAVDRESQQVQGAHVGQAILDAVDGQDVVLSKPAL
jgi:hypothetical protein